MQNILVQIVDDSSSAIIHAIPYLNAAPRHGAPISGVLNVLLYEAKGLGDLEALVVTGDLQFRERHPRHDRPIRRMLGEVLAEELTALAERGTLPPTETTGIIRTGDLYCEETLVRRGGLGDVREIWQSFAEQFAFVAGVAGNHDSFGEGQERAAFRASAGRHLLDLDIVELYGLKMGGLSGIIGDTRRPSRRLEDEYLAAVELLLSHPLDLLVLHQAPGDSVRGLPGSERLREILEAGRPTFVACGHSHWAKPIIELTSGTAVLNVDARCVVLVSRKWVPKTLAPPSTIS
jgi:Icc protein